jgi:hypothetical protein
VGLKTQQTDHPPAEANDPGRAQLWRKLDWGVCLAATAAALTLHVVFLTHAGPLWRDEANGVGLATFFSLPEMWRMLAYDSFPALFPMVLRCWSACGLGGSDLALRCLGFGIGISLLAALWLNARVLRGRLPLVSLGLLASNLTLVRDGDWLRGYGLGCVLILLSLAATWRLMKAPSPARFLVAMLAAALSVQCLFQNSFLVLTICLAGCFVCFRCNQTRTALLVLGSGAAAAVSLLPYLGHLSFSQHWRIVQQTGVSASAAGASLAGALGEPMGWQAAVWIPLILFAGVRGLIELGGAERRRRVGVEDLALFGGLIVAMGVPVFVVCILMAKLATQPWYWLPPMVVSAVCIDAALGDWLDRFRPWRLALVGLMVFVPLGQGIGLACYRQTTIDAIASRLREEAKPHDLVLVYPWYFGITFNRYYHGAAPWTTVPALSDNRIHRYDLLKEKLAAPNPIKPLLDQVAQAVEGGNRVWIVGDLPKPQAGETVPPDLPPAPGGSVGWYDVPYSYVWGRQLDYFLVSHGYQAQPVPLTIRQAVNPYEEASLSVVKGF